jgi:hypothetical protein
MDKLPKILQYAVVVIGLISCLMILFGAENDVLNSTGISGLNLATTITIAAMVIGALVALAFGVMTTLSKGKKAMPTLIGIAAFLVVCAVSYAVASDAIPPKVDVTADTSKMVSAGLTLFYILLGGTFAAIIIGEVRSLMS